MRLTSGPAIGSGPLNGYPPAWLRTWRSVQRLSGAMRAGDTAYVGPGLYREGVVVRHGGTPEARLMVLRGADRRPIAGIVLV